MIPNSFYCFFYFQKLFKMSLLLAQLTDSPKPRNAMAGVVKIGYLKKNKSMRKKFFVLREATAGGGPARLEYYETEKKWRNNALPKKYVLHTT